MLAPVSGFVDAALQAAPEIRVLATSREGLVVPGERLLMVPPLRIPGTGTSTEEILQSESVRLFVDRARESNSAFIGESEDAPAMMELCRRLDGIPLAIELAAARVGSMTPTEITAHLTQRFKLLSRGRRTVATRQQTLRNTIDWSYDLLHDSERRVLRRLSVFAGGFGLEATESVVAGDDVDSLDVVDLLARLVEKSLVVAEGQSGVTRYRLARDCPRLRVGTAGGSGCDRSGCPAPREPFRRRGRGGR